MFLFRAAQDGCQFLHHMLRRMSCLPWLQTVSLQESTIRVVSGLSADRLAAAKPGFGCSTCLAP